MTTKATKCPGCGSDLANNLGRDNDGLYVSGLACEDCEMWEIPFRDGKVRVKKCPRKQLNRPLGTPVHAYDVAAPGDCA